MSQLDPILKRIFDLSPDLQEYVAKKLFEVAKRYPQDILEVRFGVVPRDIAEMVLAVKEVAVLNSLHRYSATCRSLDEFRDELIKVQEKNR